MNDALDKQQSPQLLWDPDADDQHGWAFLIDPLVEVTQQKLAANARLYAVATEQVSQSIRDMERKRQAAIAENPDLAPYLNAYFEAARITLMQNTLAVLDGSTKPRQEALPKDHHWRSIHKVIPNYQTRQAIKTRLRMRGANRHGAAS